MAEKIKVRRLSDGKTLLMTREFFKTTRGFEIATDNEPRVEKAKDKKQKKDAEATGSSTRL
jgi:hypothetical protein